jgi:hypothetical protein
MQRSGGLGNVPYSADKYGQKSSMEYPGLNSNRASFISADNSRLIPESSPRHGLSSVKLQHSSFGKETPIVSFSNSSSDYDHVHVHSSSLSSYRGARFGDGSYQSDVEDTLRRNAEYLQQIKLRKLSSTDPFAPKSTNATLPSESVELERETSGRDPGSAVRESSRFLELKQKTTSLPSSRYDYRRALAKADAMLYSVSLAAVQKTPPLERASLSPVNTAPSIDLLQTRNDMLSSDVLNIVTMNGASQSPEKGVWSYSATPPHDAHSEMHLPSSETMLGSPDPMQMQVTVRQESNGGIIHVIREEIEIQADSRFDHPAPRLSQVLTQTPESLWRQRKVDEQRLMSSEKSGRANVGEQVEKEAEVLLPSSGGVASIQSPRRSLKVSKRLEGQEQEGINQPVGVIDRKAALAAAVENPLHSPAQTLVLHRETGEQQVVILPTTQLPLVSPIASTHSPVSPAGQEFDHESENAVAKSMDEADSLSQQPQNPDLERPMTSDQELGSLSEEEEEEEEKNEREKETEKEKENETDSTAAVEKNESKVVEVTSGSESLPEESGEKEQGNPSLSLTLDAVTAQNQQQQPVEPEDQSQEQPGAPLVREGSSSSNLSKKEQKEAKKQWKLLMEAQKKAQKQEAKEAKEAAKRQKKENKGESSSSDANPSGSSLSESAAHPPGMEASASPAPSSAVSTASMSKKERKEATKQWKLLVEAQKKAQKKAEAEAKAAEKLKKKRQQRSGGIPADPAAHASQPPMHATQDAQDERGHFASEGDGDMMSASESSQEVHPAQMSWTIILKDLATQRATLEQMPLWEDFRSCVETVNTAPVSLLQCLMEWSPREEEPIISHTSQLGRLSSATILQNPLVSPSLLYYLWSREALRIGDQWIGGDGTELLFEDGRGPIYPDACAFLLVLAELVPSSLTLNQVEALRVAARLATAPSLHLTGDHVVGTEPHTPTLGHRRLRALAKKEVTATASPTATPSASPSVGVGVGVSRRALAPPPSPSQLAAPALVSSPRRNAPLPPSGSGGVDGEEARSLSLSGPSGDALSFRNVSDHGVVISWNGLLGSGKLSKFRLYRRRRLSSDEDHQLAPSVVSAQYVTVFEGITTSFYDATLRPDTLYVYALACWHVPEGKWSQPGTPRAVQTRGSMAPLPPSPPAFSHVTSTSVVVFWSPYTSNGREREGEREDGQNHGNEVQGLESAAADTEKVAKGTVIYALYGQEAFRGVPTVDQVPLYRGADTTFTHTGCQPGQSYIYGVVVETSAGCSVMGHVGRISLLEAPTSPSMRRRLGMTARDHQTADTMRQPATLPNNAKFRVEAVEWQS